MTGTLLVWIIAFAVFVIVAIWILNGLYIRCAPDRAMVRTGWGGMKVALDGGLFILPFAHRLTHINLGLTRIRLVASDSLALVTLDKMRINVEVEFFFRVGPDKSSVSMAASSLGDLTNHYEDLASFFESEFLGALRSAAVRQEMEALHEDRVGFSESVHSLIKPVLERHGLVLESVAIRDLTQTGLEHFDPSNRFDAEGLTHLIKTVEQRRELRNQIEQKTAVSIREANLAAERETLALDRESQLARLQQEREIETKRAEQSAAIARKRAEREADAEVARIEAGQATNQREIAAREEVERERLMSERELDKNRILREQELRRLEIEREKFVDLAKIEKVLAVLEKSLEQADAQIGAEEKLTAASRSEEAVAMAREVGAAERESAVSRLVSERDATAEQVRSAVLIEAERLRNEAENVLTSDARSNRLRMKLIDHLEGIIRESVKPLEKIDGIKMVHLGGSGGGGHRTPTDEVIDSALRYRVQAPMIDELMKEMGIEGSNISKMGDVFRSAKDAHNLSELTKDSGSSDDSGDGPSSSSADNSDETSGEGSSGSSDNDSGVRGND